eukprot:5202676-Amphidinium_carterae.1
MPSFRSGANSLQSFVWPNLERVFVGLLEASMLRKRLCARKRHYHSDHEQRHYLCPFPHVHDHSRAHASFQNRRLTLVAQGLRNRQTYLPYVPIVKTVVSLQEG